MDLITASALRAGFTGGVVIDYPNSAKAKKYYLTLFAGPPPQNYQQPKALGADTADERSATFVDDRSLARRKRKTVKGAAGGVSKPAKKSREWIMKKKEHQKMLGKHVKADSKYTGRKRKSAF